MQKVLCVDIGNWCDRKNRPLPSPLVLKNEYHVLNDVVGPLGIYYQLVELDRRSVFHHSLFATLPAADADQMNEEVRESITNLETVLV